MFRFWIRVATEEDNYHHRYWIRPKGGLLLSKATRGEKALAQDVISFLIRHDRRFGVQQSHRKQVNFRGKYPDLLSFSLLMLMSL